MLKMLILECGDGGCTFSLNNSIHVLSGFAVAAEISSVLFTSLPIPVLFGIVLSIRFQGGLYFLDLRVCLDRSLQFTIFLSQFWFVWSFILLLIGRGKSSGCLLLQCSVALLGGKQQPTVILKDNDKGGEIVHGHLFHGPLDDLGGYCANEVVSVLYVFFLQLPETIGDLFI
jgi:hypothetical protein